MQEALMEQNKLKKQTENAEREFHSQKNKLTSAYTEEKKMLIEVRYKQFLNIFLSFVFQFFVFY